jgi:hypothetical protein
MSEGANFLVDRVLGDVPVRHWVLSLPHPLRYLLAYDKALCTEVLGAFLDSVFGWLRRKAKTKLGLSSVRLAHPGAVTVVQRCSSHLALNVHFHTLATDGVFVVEEGGSVRFCPLPAPSDEEVTEVAWKTCQRVRALLIRRGLWEEDTNELGEDPLAESDPGLAQLYQASVRGVLSLGPRAGERTVRFFGEAASEDSGVRRVSGGFNLHARQSIGAGDRVGLERLCRYLLRPPLAQKRLRILPDGSVYLGLKRAWGDGTKGFQFEPVEFLARLAALVPQPRGHTTRFHGVFASNARLRNLVVPDVPQEEAVKVEPDTGRGNGDWKSTRNQAGRLSWAQLMKRVFDVDVLKCPRCGDGMQRIAFVTAWATIQKILRSIGLSADSPELSPRRPVEDLFRLPCAA